MRITRAIPAPPAPEVLEAPLEAEFTFPDFRAEPPEWRTVGDFTLEACATALRMAREAATPTPGQIASLARRAGLDPVAAIRGAEAERNFAPWPPAMPRLDRAAS